MIQIALLLFGVDFVRSKARFLGFLGAVWGLIGIGIFIDGIDGTLYFPIKTFGVLLLLESLVTLSVAASGVGAQKALLYFKGGLFCFVALLILSNKTYSNLLLAIIFGFAYFIIGALVIASAWVVRYPRWKQAMAGGGCQILFAIFMFSPYPTHYQATVSFFLGVLMFISGVNTLLLARRANQLSEGTSVFALLAPSDILSGLTKKSAAKPRALPPEHVDFTGPLTVHIWTPEGAASARTIPRPVINRYIAAVDTQGVISTGHAALELSPKVYISLYPAADIDRSPSEFLRLLKATRDNDVDGSFQPDYATEAANWCESDRKILFHEYNGPALLRYWDVYQRQKTYNLTSRNCSSSVAYALEASLDGVLAEQGKHWRPALRTLFMPELWIAAQVRRRAITMAWTPGLVMDYARALRAIVHPVPQSWYQRMPWKWRVSDDNKAGTETDKIF